MILNPWIFNKDDTLWFFIFRLLQIEFANFFFTSTRLAESSFWIQIWKLIFAASRSQSSPHGLLNVTLRKWQQTPEVEPAAITRSQWLTCHVTRFGGATSLWMTSSKQATWAHTDDTPTSWNSSRQTRRRSEVFCLLPWGRGLVCFMCGEIWLWDTRSTARAGGRLLMITGPIWQPIWQPIWTYLSLSVSLYVSLSVYASSEKGVKW